MPWSLLGGPRRPLLRCRDRAAPACEMSPSASSYPLTPRCRKGTVGLPERRDVAAPAARSSAEADAEALSPLGFVFFQMLLSFTAKGPMHSSASCDVCKEGSSSTHRIKPRGTGHELWIPAVSFFFFLGFFFGVFFFLTTTGETEPQRGAHWCVCSEAFGAEPHAKARLEPLP